MKELEKYFNQLSPLKAETWANLKPLFSKKKLLKGEYFIEQGQLATKIGFLESGVIRAFYRNDEGVEYNKHFFIPNALVGGYASMITGRPNVIIQQALIDCDLLVADFSQLSALYNSHPDLERVARRLAEFFFVDKENREIEIILLEADKRYELFQKRYPSLEQLIPQYHIASYLGITPTQLSRIRKKLSQR
ncbi:putative transcriptional regulator, Crp/Fnr family [Emticicia oligotrophica DSM 17448]|uniref:Transcriptional regulator, Crp/Fnr family n=1 Tax=Emticicia oligotrophica (strain DSM 17448 / CIP 109782 / MTCC 6937 / GPTSA100-15) TaxID=929562 RepID=A0ABN4AMI1_EMTOG|nr:Crp/Fnr family transcriptional regulator [Emticicia oligotrophica]AFK03307.1 putative transcriptional regulator, Crp/Fnr family [Emticicia oligotrophica DSM 17448]